LASLFVIDGYDKRNWWRKSVVLPFGGACCVYYSPLKTDPLIGAQIRQGESGGVWCWKSEQKRETRSRTIIYGIRTLTYCDYFDKKRTIHLLY